MASRGKLGFHPRWGTELERVGWFDRTCTIQSQVENRTATGDVSYDWQTVEGLDNIRCQISRVTPDREQMKPDDIVQTSRGKVLLWGYYPEISPAMRCIISDDPLHIFDIEDVNIPEFDGVTRLDIKYVPLAAVRGLEG